MRLRSIVGHNVSLQDRSMILCCVQGRFRRSIHRAIEDVLAIYPGVPLTGSVLGLAHCCVRVVIPSAKRTALICSLGIPIS